MGTVKTHSIKFNFIMNGLLTALNVLFPLVTFPYNSRVLLPLGTGKVAFATSLVTYFMIFASLGVPTYGIREVAKVRDDKEALSKLVQELLVINLMTCVISYILFFCLIGFVPRFQGEWTLYAVVSISIFFNTIGVEWLYKGIEQYAYITIRSAIFKLIALGAMFLLVTKPEDYIIYGGISIFASVGSNICNFINRRKHVTLKVLVDKSFIRHFKPAAVFMAMSIASSIYTHFAVLMLGLMTSDVAVGYYNAALKIRIVLLSLITSLGAVLLPRLSYYVSHGMTEEFTRVSVLAMSFVAIAAGGLSVFFIPYAYDAMMILAGGEYLNAVLPMQLLMPTLFIVGISNLTGVQILIPLGKEKIVLQSIIAGGLVDVCLNLILIPKLAATGAAIGTLCAEVVVLGFQIVALRGVIIPLVREVQWGRIIIAIAVALVASLPIYLFVSGFFARLIFGALMFFFVEGVVLLLAKEQLTLKTVHDLKGAIKRKSRTDASDADGGN